MNKLEIHKSISQVKSLLNEHRVKEAFFLMNELNGKAEQWKISDELRRLEETYRYMIHYMVEGIDDPYKDKLYSDMISRMSVITDEIERNLLCQFANNTLYLNHLHRHIQQPYDIKNIILSYSATNEKVELSSEVGMVDNNILKEKERLLSDIFIAIWLIQHLSDKDYQTISDSLNSDSSTYELKCQIISAILLGTLQYYDSKKIELLLNIYHSTNDKKIGIRALVCAILTMHHYREQASKDPLLRNILESLTDKHDFLSDVKSIIFDFIRTRDTDRISKKMKDEVIPEIMKLQPEIMKRFKNSDPDTELELDINNMEENPEWAELLDKSGLGNKLKELSELQMEGGDVFMIAFSNLKNFPFFYKVSNWFLPFSTSHSELAALREINNENLMNLICGDSIMCDSDKYSFAISVAQMPHSQRTMMMQQMDAQFEQIKQHHQNSLEHNLTSDYKTEASKYIKDLYRFFKLFNHRSEFIDPFKSPINFIYLPVIGEGLANEENLRLIGEFYFNRGYYNDARALFAIIEANGNCDDLILQKIGFCYQSEKAYDKALDYYKKAEILNPDNSWLIKKIALCHKNLMQYEQAATYYEKALEKNASNLNLVMNLGHCLLQAGHIDEALKCYYKVEYLDEKSNRALRPIAWCEFELGNYEQSRKYYNKVISNNPNAQDYMNFGHLELASKNLSLALSLYANSIKNSSKEEFRKSFLEDSELLVRLGIKAIDLPIIIDKLLYDLDN